MLEHCYNRCIRATLAAGGHLVKYCWIMQEQAIFMDNKNIDSVLHKHIASKEDD